MNIKPTEAFHWLNNNMVEALESPDAHFDWVYMLEPQDWNELARIYPDKPPAWREAWAYVVVQGPVAGAADVLRVALKDAEPRVSRQAALSVIDLNDLFPDEFPVNREMLADLRRIAARDDASLDDVRAFVDRQALRKTTENQ